MNQNVTNAAFLAAIRANSEEYPEGTAQWVCHWHDQNTRWNGQKYDPSVNIEHEDKNTYFCISMLKPVNGKIQRKKENFAALPCIVLDDVGTKATRPSLEPSWILETSPENYQYGYILDRPITDPSEADEIMKAVIDAGYCDKSAGGPATRYMRLPVGSNSKPEHIAANGGKPWQHILKTWHPERKFSLKQLIEGLDLKFNDPKEPLAPDNISNAISERINDSDLIYQILNHESYHNNLLVLTARYQARGMKRNDIIETLTGVLQGNGDTSERAKERLKDIPRMVDSAILKFQPPKKKFSIASAAEFANRKQADWLIKNILPQTGLAMVFGESGAGKSFFVLNIVGAIARGVPWEGHKIKKSYKVLYIAAEGAEGFRKRLRAYAVHNQVDLNNISLKVLDGAPNIYAEDTEALIQAILETGEADVIVFDTLAQVTAGANENAGEDMGLVMARCQEISKACNALVILVHHSGKDASKGSRGWSGLKAPLDTEITISKQENSRVAKISKQKDGEEGQVFAFNLHEVCLENDDDGDPVTSCIVVFNPILNIERKTKKLGKWEKVIMDAVGELSGIGSHSVSIGTLLDKAQEAYPYDSGQNPLKPKRDSRRDSAHRALGRLSADGVLTNDNGEIYLPHLRISPQMIECEDAKSGANSSHLPQHPIGVRNCEAYRNLDDFI
jgi:hypothetical protein